MVNQFDVFLGVTAFAQLDDGKRYPLKLKSQSGDTLEFEEQALGITFSASVATYGKIRYLKYKAEYNPHGLGEIPGRNHFDYECTVGLHVKGIRGVKRFFATYNKSEFWVHPFFGELNALPEFTQAILTQNGSDYSFFTTLCDKEFVSTIKGFHDGFDIYVWNNCLPDSVDTVALTWGRGNDPYTLPFKVNKETFLLLGKTPVMRTDKEYPGVFEYLGWCSWDAFHMEVTHADLINKAREFKEKGIPVRWFILDDMWGDVPNNNIPTMQSRELNSFEAAPDRFPKGLNGIVKELKENYNLKVGLWHPATGYWHGINPNSPLAKEYKDYLFWSTKKQLIPRYERDVIEEYYDRQHGFYSECGVDFMKVDYQSHLRWYEKLAMPIGKAADNFHNAVERANNKYFGGALINCMGMATENFWNRKSAVCRFSGDFCPESRKWFSGHILQCAYNSIVQGSVYYGDWDMWWSDDTQAIKNSVIKAMSGGPIYVSDKLGRSKKNVIMPTVFSDGRIIRLDSPARPSPDCLFEDARESGRAFKLFNTHNESGIIAVFNIDKDERPVFADITAADMLIDENKEYCVYDWFSEAAFRISGKDSFRIELKNYDEFKLYIFAPLKDGKAVIGLKNKYMSPATYKISSSGEAVPLDVGELLIFNSDELSETHRSQDVAEEDL
ncbi:MAG: alpha-galactosidase [Clostridia bacterium]|nr:alpha-galactosidase [Clostridia bacterium]